MSIKTRKIINFLSIAAIILIEVLALLNKPSDPDDMFDYSRIFVFILLPLFVSLPMDFYFFADLTSVHDLLINWQIFFAVALALLVLLLPGDLYSCFFWAIGVFTFLYILNHAVMVIIAKEKNLY